MTLGKYTTQLLGAVVSDLAPITQGYGQLGSKLCRGTEGCPLIWEIVEVDCVLRSVYHIYSAWNSMISWKEHGPGV